MSANAPATPMMHTPLVFIFRVGWLMFHSIDNLQEITYDATLMLGTLRGHSLITYGCFWPFIDHVPTPLSNKK